MSQSQHNCMLFMCLYTFSPARTPTTPPAAPGDVGHHKGLRTDPQLGAFLSAMGQKENVNHSFQLCTFLLQWFSSKVE